MLGLQAAIGALNDVLDAPLDAGRKPGKPIPAGTVGRRLALIVASVAATVGLLLTLPSGAPAVLVALAILAVGAVYDAWLKGTAWSWLPFAVGIPLLPVYAWVGATGTLPGVFAVLLPAGVAAGAALAIANALADLERDRSAGSGSIAVRLGRRRAWALHAGLHALVLLTAFVSLVAWRVPIERSVAAVAAGGLPVIVGLALSARLAPGSRERGWELQAIGIAVLAGTWFVLAIPR